MSVTRNNWMITLAFLLLTASAVAQKKVERETRIHEKEVPENALNWFNEVFPKADKVKWYAEETSGKQSFEAKLRYNDQKLSVEFSEAGQIEDIESEIGWKSLSASLQQNLDEYFDQHYRRYSIRKIQRQWTGSEESLKSAPSHIDSEEVTTRYEIEFYGVDDDRKALWEGLFTNEGQLIRKREVILRPTDNLNY